jgi:hypothetical protein
MDYHIPRPGIPNAANTLPQRKLAPSGTTFSIHHFDEKDIHKPLWMTQKTIHSLLPGKLMPEM